MQITKAIFDAIAPGEIFRTVTTRIQNFHDPMTIILTFVCVKAKTHHEGTYLWAIYASRAGSHPDDVARYGDKVQNKANILSICPCDDDVYELYRH